MTGNESFIRLNENLVRVTRFSPVSKTFNTKDIEFTETQWNQWLDGRVIQLAMPHLSPGDREFIVSGITESEWQSLYGKYDQGKEACYTPVIK